MSKRFSRLIEDFECQNCGNLVEGNGYTNHCPKCLWSLHVDIFPGDRQNSCRGMMEPVGVTLKNGDYSIVHKCVKCQQVQKCKMSPDDDIELIYKLLPFGGN